MKQRLTRTRKAVSEVTQPSRTDPFLDRPRLAMALIGQELQRELDELVATHASALASLATAGAIERKPLPSRPSQDPATPLLSRLECLRYKCQAFAKRCLSQVLRALLSWMAARGQDQIASWLVAHLLLSILQTQHTAALTVDAMAQVSNSVLSASVGVFQDIYQRESAKTNESTSFFAFKSSAHNARSPSAESLIQDAVVAQWRLVLAKLALCDSLSAVRARFQTELGTHILQSSKHSNGPTRQHAFLQHLSELCLNLASSDGNAPAPIALKMKQAGLFLKLLYPFMLKPNKTSMRLNTIAMVASIIQRELKDLDRADLRLVYTTAHVGEWNSSLSDLHAFAMKTCSKKALAASAWELRIAVLCLSPMDIFTRYWKDDVHALLRLQYQHNKDSHSTSSQTALECIALGFRHVLLRHFIMDRNLPSESDCMEIINTMQAWCFFSVAKHKGTLQRFRDCVLPLLVDISIGIAAYNMAYAVQSHLRRLLMEVESIFDEKKLVGLEALVRICQECVESTDADAQTRVFQLDTKTLRSNRNVLGDLVGHILIECNTSFGQEAVTPASATVAASTSRFMRDDHKRAVAVEIFGTALFSLQYVYTAIELSEDQKLLLLARATIHTDLYIRQRANQALHAIVCIAEKSKAGLVIRGLTDYLLRLSHGTTILGGASAFSILIRLISSLLETATGAQDLAHWESSRDVEDSLVQIEAACLYLFVYEDAQLRLHVLDALETVRTTRRQMALSRYQPSVMDAIDALEPELGCTFFGFETPSDTNMLKPRGDNYFKHLAGPSSRRRASFRWSYCLSMVYSRLTCSVPEVTASIWSEMRDKTIKLEPVMPSIGDNEANNAGELARWRNLAIFCTSTACIMPCNSVDSTASSIQTVISMNSVATLFKRLGRYLKSFSIDQKKAAILALGSTNASSLPMLVEVLDKYEPEAFELDRRSLQPQFSQRTESISDMNAATGTLNTITNRNQSKVFRAKYSKPVSQLHLQWAMCRCYRLCLDTMTRYQMQSNNLQSIIALEVFLLSVRGFLGKMRSVMENRSRLTGRKDNGHFDFMMQQDFCVAVREYVRLSACLTRHQETREAATASSDNKQTLEGMFELLHSLTSSSLGSIASSRVRNEMKNAFFDPNVRIYDCWLHHCDVFGDRAYDTIIPWHWVDEELRPIDSDGITDSQLQSSQHIFTCQSAFSAMAALLECFCLDQRPIDSISCVFKWLDECFGVNANAISCIQPLQHFCKQGLRTLLQSESSNSISAICIEKSYFTQSGHEHQLLAKRYFESLSDQTAELRRELENQKSSQLVVRILQMFLLHLGVQNEESHRVLALKAAKRMFVGLIEWPLEIMIREASSRRSPLLANRIMDHSQMLVSSALASKFSTTSFALCCSLLKFLKDCDGTLQSQLLGVLVPWFAELDLDWLQSDNNDQGDQSAESLLSLLFRTTTDLNGANSNALENIWLALAFHQSHNQSLEESRAVSPNLSSVIQFLFVQRTSLEQLDTARLIFWWLCRWQQASSQVVRTLANCVLMRRRQLVFSVDCNGNTDCPVDDVSVFIALVSDSSSHLRIYSSSTDIDLIIQVIHNAFLTLFAVIESKRQQPSVQIPRNSRSPGHSTDSSALESTAYEDIHQDCLAVLRALIPKLQTSIDLFESVSKRICAELETTSAHRSTCGKLKNLLCLFADSMSTEKIALWSDVCITEILLAISAPDSQAPPMNDHQAVVCVRFALLAYESLAPAFHGDVYLSVLELLHSALDSQKRDETASIILIQDCLATLAGLTKRIPVAQLALYPQIFWVCLALLNHSKQFELHPSILTLLLEIVSKPHFATNQLLQDIFISKRPTQWINPQCSVLQSVTSNLHGSCIQSRKLTRRIIVKLVLFPQQFLCMEFEEHLIISAISLLPELEAAVSDDDVQSSSIETCAKYQLLDAFSSLSALLSESKYDGCRKLGEWLHQYTTPEQQLSSSLKASIPESFAAIFIPMVLEIQHCCPQMDAISTTLGILLRMSSTDCALVHQDEDSSQPSEDWQPPVVEDAIESDIAIATLRIMDALLVRLESHSFSWTPPMSLLSALVQITHAPKQCAQWQTAVRLLSYIATTSNAISLPSFPQQQRRHLSIAILPPEVTVPSTAPTPAKRDSLGSARKFMNLMTMRSNNNPHSDPPPSVPKYKDPAASERTSLSDQQQSGEDVRA